MEMVSGAAMTLLMITFGPYLLRMFTGDDQVIRMGMQAARMLTPFYAVFAISEITGSALRAEGHVMVNTVANLLGVCVFRIIWVTVINPQGSFQRILMCYPISWIVTSVVEYILYLRIYGKVCGNLKEALPEQ